MTNDTLFVYSKIKQSDICIKLPNNYNIFIEFAQRAVPFI